MNKKWSELGHSGDKITLDLNSLTASNPDGSDFKAIDYTVKGNAGSTAFTAVAHVKLIPSPPYGIYKNTLETNVDIQGVSDDKIKNDI